MTSKLSAGDRRQVKIGAAEGAEKPEWNNPEEDRDFFGDCRNLLLRSV